MVRERSPVQFRQMAQHMAETLRLTKTDFVHYLRCPKSLWLLKRKPEMYPRGEFSDFLKKITLEGYEVEAYAETLFPGGVKLPAVGNAEEKTREALEKKTPVLFQATFAAEDGQFARTDILERNGDGTYSLCEVKSSTEVKRGAKRDHIKDACFQKIALEKNGLRVGKVYIIHANGAYVRGGAVNPYGLLKKTEVTEAVEEAEEGVKVDIQNALALLRADAIDETGCSCYRKTRSNHCDAFAHFNGEYPPHAVWELGNIREKKLNELLERGAVTLSSVPDDIELNERQMRQVRSVIENRPIIDAGRIRELFGTLQFPLYFFDYETASNAVPRIEGTGPWQQIPFQYSLHTLHTDGTLRHTDCVSESLSGCADVIRSLTESAGKTGSFVSWHASFEKTRNTEMGKCHPEYREALGDINERTFDLEDVCKEAYTDARFRGSTSIKKVLPVLCPELSYEGLAVRDGTQAMERWFAMIESEDESERAEILENLREYCKLDTLAMVEIYRALRSPDIAVSYGCMFPLPSSRAGFTLIEVLVAISILSSVVFVPLSIIADRLVENALTESRVRARLLAQETIEYVRYDRDSAVLAHKSWFSDIRSPDSSVNKYRSCFTASDDWIAGTRDRYCEVLCRDTVASVSPSSGACGTVVSSNGVVTASYDGFVTGVSTVLKKRGTGSWADKTCDGNAPKGNGGPTAALNLVISAADESTRYAVAVACVSWSEDGTVHSVEHEEALFEWITEG